MRRVPFLLPVLFLFLFITAACTQPPETLPAAPTGLTARPDSGTVILNWNYSGPALAGYRVYRSDTEAVTANDALLNGELITARTFTDTDTTVANGGTYYYMVSAVNAAGNVSPGSNVARAAVPSPDVTPPAAPANLRASPGDAEVTLTWDAVGEPTLAGYRVYRSLTGEVDTSWELLTAELVTDGSYRDLGLTNGTTYHYMVVAVAMSGSVSTGSARVSATPMEVPDEAPPAVPTGLTAEAGNAQVVLRWDGNAEPGLAGYNVYRGLAIAVDVSGAPLNPLPLTTAEYADTFVTNDVTYYYVVTAIGESGSVSAPSNVVAATPQRAEFELTPHELVFSTVRGEASEAQSLDILNTGTSPLEITGVSLSGPNADAFTLETPLTGPLSLVPGQRESFGIS
ncbi:MAG: hypothetical protein M3511_12470, partial [Deinococcota bacterium]|nr:hypothetical protein [Deinococcota bacterium]